MAARASATAPPRWPSRSPSPTPVPTRTTSPPPPAATATSWVLKGQKIYISGVDEADNVLVVARAEDARTGKLKPCLFVVPTDAEGFECTAIPMEIVSPEQQFQVFIDDVRLPADALVGDEDGGLVQLFAGLNPERIMAASFSTGLARFALERRCGVRQGADRLQGPDRLPPGHRPPARAVAHRDRAGPADDAEGGRAVRRRRRHGAPARRPTWRSTPPPRPPATPPTAPCRPTAATASRRSTAWPGCWSPTRAGRIAPVSREMILNFVAMHIAGAAEVLLTRRRSAFLDRPVTPGRDVGVRRKKFVGSYVGLERPSRAHCRRVGLAAPGRRRRRW